MTCPTVPTKPSKSGNDRLTALAVAGLIIVGTVGCMPVAPYQRAFLNGVDMELATPKPQTFESNVEAYREGAAGANGGKIGGGCGCS